MAGGSEISLGQQLVATLKDVNKLIEQTDEGPPLSKLIKQRNQLVSQMGQFDQVISDAASALEGGDAQTIQEAQTTLATSVAKIGTDVSKTISDINQKLQD